MIPVVFAACLVTASSAAQTTGSITGRITDTAGGALPGVSVEATSASLQGRRASTTGAYGEYRLSALPPGAYQIRASLPGFRKAQALATVGIDVTVTLNLALHPSAQEEVVVHGGVPFVDTTSTMSATGYTSRVISHLPCDRNFASIVSASPGVNADHGSNQLRSQALAIKGATSAENQWIVDGVNTTDVQRGIQGKAINNEFVEEVEVKTGGYQAEYGRALGGVINVVTKSGGNEFHGDSFFYYDSSSLQADRVFTSDDRVIDSMQIVDYERRDFGADLGGHFLKDRLWFFAAYDRIEFPAEISRVVPTDRVSTDDRFPLDGTTNLYSGKLTWNVTPSTSAVASVFADPTTSEGAGAADPQLGHAGVAPDPITNLDPSTWYSTRFVGGIDYGLRLTRLLGSSGMLVFQGGRHEDRFELTAPGGIRTRDFTCEGGTPEEPCARPAAPNFETGGYGQILGFQDSARSRRGQYRGDLTLYAGNHTLKAGADYQRAITDTTDFYTGKQLVDTLNQQGVLYYLHRFYSVSSEGWTPADRISTRSHVRDVGAYVQDSWKPFPGWTVNAGLRWDEEQIGSSRIPSYIETSRWQPRLGVGWDPWNDGKTRVYGFAGRFSWGLATDLPVRSSLGGGFEVRTFNFDPIDVTPDPSVPGHPDSMRWSNFGPPVVDAGLEGIYQDELSLGLERQLDPTLSVGLTATYRRLGNAIEDRCDLDGEREETNYNTCAIVNPGSDGRIARGDIPWCTGLDDDHQCFDSGPATPPARRVYRGIELIARKTLGERLWLQASWVYSSLRGNYDGAVSQNSGQTDPGINADFDYAQFSHNSYGRLFLDRPHRLRFDGYYTAPFGLSVGLQAFAASGVPLEKTGYFSFWYPGSIHLVPRGRAGRMPTAWEANLTLSYPIRKGPATVTLQGYVFNLFDNQIPVWKDTSWSNSPPANYPDTLYDPNQEQTNPEYGKIVARQDPRLFRAAVRVSF